MASKDCVWCLCMCVLFCVRVGVGFVDCVEKGFMCCVEKGFMCKKSFEVCIALRKGLYVRRILKCALR